MTWEYVAGFFDGEGTAGLYVRHDIGQGGSGRVMVQMVQKRPEVLQEISSFLSSHGYKNRLKFRNDKTRNPIYCLLVCESSALSFLRKLAPYLRVKRIQVQDIVRFRTVFPVFNLKQSNFLRREARWGNLPPVKVVQL